MEKQTNKQNKYKSVCPIFLHQVQMQIVFSSFIYLLFGSTFRLSATESLQIYELELFLTPANILFSFRLLLFLFYIQQIDKTMLWNCSTKKEADKSAMQTKFIKTKQNLRENRATAAIY